MKIVKVIDIPVRYEDKTYRAGETFEIESEHVNDKLVEVIGDVEKVPEPPVDPEDLTVDEIKEKLDELEIPYKSKDKKEDLITLLEGNSEEQENQDDSGGE